MTSATASTTSVPHTSRFRLAVAWLMVGIPLAYGIYETLLKAAKLFAG